MNDMLFCVDRIPLYGVGFELLFFVQREGGVYTVV